VSCCVETLIDEDIVGDWWLRESDRVVWQGKIEWILVWLAILSLMCIRSNTNICAHSIVYWRGISHCGGDRVFWIVVQKDDCPSFRCYWSCSTAKPATGLGSHPDWTISSGSEEHVCSLTGLGCISWSCHNLWSWKHSHQESQSLCCRE
jgi:hypothetical protein